MKRKPKTKEEQLIGKILAGIALLSLFTSELGGFLFLIVAVGVLAYIGFRLGKKSGRTSKKKTQYIPFDDCPKPVCFHKDKGEHHVRKGREIDPWDRPDIDISKYQRRQ